LIDGFFLSAGRHAPRVPAAFRYRVLWLGLFLSLGLPGAASRAEAPRLFGAPALSAGSFSFVVHGDLTGGERAGIFAVAAQQIAMLQPTFVISVGDLIEGDGHDEAALHMEWQAYTERAKVMGVPLYPVSGNHDVTSPLQRRVWAERFGPTYYHFRFADTLFLVLDTEDYDDDRRAEVTRQRDEAQIVAQEEGWDAFAQTPYARMPERVTGAISRAQRDYFLDVLAANADVRWTFLFVHKAPWEGSGVATFAELEDALADRPYTVFHGHEHAQKVEARNGRDYIRLATTGGVQLVDKGRAVDHLALVTVGPRVSVVSLDLEGIRRPDGTLPAGSEGLCFDVRICGEP